MELKRVLLAELSKEVTHEFLRSPKAKAYLAETAASGDECLDKLERFHPDLLLVDLFLPQIHGIEVLRKIRANPKYKGMGVILLSSLPSMQNYYVAIKEGADFFIEKPIDPSTLFALIESYFQGKLHPESFTKTVPPASKPQAAPYRPEPPSRAAYIKFWGTRGSNPVSGASFVRFGGNTSCLEIWDGENLILIDAGTGIRDLGERLKPQSHGTIHLLFSHTHWDHVMGFPFFPPLFDTHTKLTLWTPICFEKSAPEVFSDMLAYAFFPVHLEDIQARLTFRDIREGEELQIGRCTISSRYAFHPGATLCFKVRIDGKTFGYATDNEFLLGHHGDPKTLRRDSPTLTSYRSLIEFFSGCDLLIHEAQFTPEEYIDRVGWGHSSMSNAALLIQLCGIKHWIITHHDPGHTDEGLMQRLELQQEILRDCHIDCTVQMAYDGLKIPMP